MHKKTNTAGTRIRENIVHSPHPARSGPNRATRPVQICGPIITMADDNGKGGGGDRRAHVRIRMLELGDDGGVPTPFGSRKPYPGLESRFRAFLSVLPDTVPIALERPLTMVIGIETVPYGRVMMHRARGQGSLPAVEAAEESLGRHTPTQESVDQDSGTCLSCISAYPRRSSEFLLGTGV